MLAGALAGGGLAERRGPAAERGPGAVGAGGMGAGPPGGAAGRAEGRGTEGASGRVEGRRVRTGTVSSGRHRKTLLDIWDYFYFITCRGV